MDYINNYWKILGAYESMWHLLCSTPLITYVVAHATSSHSVSFSCCGRLIGRCDPSMLAPVAGSPCMAARQECKPFISFANSARSLDILGCRMLVLWGYVQPCSCCNVMGCDVWIGHWMSLVHVGTYLQMQTTSRHVSEFFMTAS